VHYVSVTVYVKLEHETVAPVTIEVVLRFKPAPLVPT
jgi:hypothetical protein